MPMTVGTGLGADPRNVPVFDPSVRGRTDQFALLMKKPG